MMVKEKQDRTYDEGFRLRAACIVVRSESESEVMLITSSRTKDCWIVPGGGIEDNETPEEAAVRETLEEAGVCGEIRRFLGDFEVFDEHKQRKHRTSVFVMQANKELDDYDDAKVRKRSWFPVERSLYLLSITKPVQCTYLNMFIRTSAALWARAGHLLNLSHPSAVMNVTIKSTTPTPATTTETTTTTNPTPPDDGDGRVPAPDRLDGQPPATKFNQVDYYSALKKDRRNGNAKNVLVYSFICTRSMFASKGIDDSDSLDSESLVNQSIIPELPQHSKAESNHSPVPDNGNVPDSSAQGSNQ